MYIIERRLLVISQPTFKPSHMRRDSYKLIAWAKLVIHRSILQIPRFLHSSTYP